MIVPGFHENNLSIERHNALAIRATVVLVLEFDNPDAFTLRSSVLLDDSGLECEALAEAFNKGFRVIVYFRVLEATVQVLDLH